jgi:hypothetical protein
VNWSETYHLLAGGMIVALVAGLLTRLENRRHRRLEAHAGSA